MSKLDKLLRELCPKAKGAGDAQVSGQCVP